MKLNSSDRDKLTKAEQFLESTQHLPTIPQGQVPDLLLHDLMASDQPDLAMVGCLIASRVDPSVNLSMLFNDPASSRNYARMLLADEPLADVMTRCSYADFQTNAKELASRLVPTKAKPSSSKPLAVTPMTIIVHGTFAATSPWWQSGGNFWTYIRTIEPELYSGSNPFSWSGQNNHAARMQGANDLVQWAKANPASKLKVIAHSHGGNVCIAASRLGLKIDKLILLGTPIRLEYLPDPSTIGEMHNVFSTNDTMQSVGTFPCCRGEGRTLPEHSTMLNHRAADDGTGGEPGHSDLHEPATWRASRLARLL